MALPTKTATELDQNLCSLMAHCDLLAYVFYISRKSNDCSIYDAVSPFRFTSQFANKYSDLSQEEFIEFLKLAGATNDLDAAMIVANSIHLIYPDQF